MTAANNTLKPCPFCGGDNVHTVKRDVEPQGDPWYRGKDELFPMCDDCGCCLFDGYFHEGFVNGEAAISKWNTRADLATRAPTEAQGDDAGLEAFVYAQIFSGREVGLSDSEIARDLAKELIRIKAAATTPKQPDIAEKLAGALSNVHKLVSRAAENGFNCRLGGDWAERLFQSQQDTSKALAAFEKQKGGAV